MWGRVREAVNKSGMSDSEFSAKVGTAALPKLLNRFCDIRPRRPRKYHRTERDRRCNPPLASLSIARSSCQVDNLTETKLQSTPHLCNEVKDAINSGVIGIRQAVIISQIKPNGAPNVPRSWDSQREFLSLLLKDEERKGKKPL